MAMSTSMVRWRSLTWGSFRSYERTRVGEWRGGLEVISLISLGDRLRRRVGEIPLIDTGDDDMTPGDDMVNAKE